MESRGKQNAWQFWKSWRILNLQASQKCRLDFEGQSLWVSSNDIYSKLHSLTSFSGDLWRWKCFKTKRRIPTASKYRTKKTSAISEFLHEMNVKVVISKKMMDFSIKYFGCARRQKLFFSPLLKRRRALKFAGATRTFPNSLLWTLSYLTSFVLEQEPPMESSRRLSRCLVQLGKAVARLEITGTTRLLCNNTRQPAQGDGGKNERNLSSLTNLVEIIISKAACTRNLNINR